MKTRALLFTLLFFICTLARAQSTAPISYAPATLIQNVGITQNLNAQLPLNLTFHDETGQPIHLSDLQRNKPILLIFVQYNCPSLCTVILNDTLSTLKVIPQTAGNQFDIWTVSFDPAETPTLAAAKKAEYLRSYLRARSSATDASAGWHFLTGDAQNIAALTQAAGYHYKYDEPTRQFIHPAGLILLTPDAKIARYFFGIDYDPTDLRLSLVEASNGKIGSLTDKLLLYCYHYDPATGKYNLAIANTLRLGALLTILLLGAAFTFLMRADRRRTQRLLQPSNHGGTP